MTEYTKFFLFLFSIRTSFYLDLIYSQYLLNLLRCTSVQFDK